VKGPLNISAITRQVAAMRGKASRRVVRGRVEKLVRRGILLKAEGQILAYRLVEKADHQADHFCAENLTRVTSPILL
jgi:DNA-binding Lrp family transcriptional regulator